MTNAELQAQVDRLTAILAERDRKAAEDKAAAIAAQEAADAAKSAAERAQAAAAERETIRRGAWVNHLIGQAKPDEPVDFGAINAAVPKDEASGHRALTRHHSCLRAGSASSTKTKPT